MNWATLNASGQPQQLEVNVNVPNAEYLFERLRGDFRAGRGFCLATLNLDHVTKLQKQPAFRAAYSDHTYITADGNPIVWLSRLAGENIQLVPGSEVVSPIAQIGYELELPIGLFGSTPASLKAASDAFEQEFPGIRIVSRISPEMGFDPESPVADQHIQELKASGARLVFLALGAPKQEIFAVRARAELPTAGFVSIGAGLDFISGQQIRAPKLVQKFAVEWLWRLAQSPRRLIPRYLACIALLPRLTLSAWRARTARVSD